MSMISPQEPQSEEPKIDTAMIRESLSTALVCDGLDAEGFRHQSPRAWAAADDGRRRPRRPMPDHALGRHGARGSSALRAGTCRSRRMPSGDMLIAAAGGSVRSGIWGSCCRPPRRTPGVRA